jgi:hypothetical protein
MKLNRDMSNIPLLGVGYLLVSFLFSKVVLLDSFFLSLIAFPSFVLVPIFIGFIIYSTIIERNNRLSFSLTSLFVNWLLGVFLLLLVCLLLSWIGVFSAEFLSYFSILFAFVGGIAMFRKLKKEGQKRNWSLPPKTILLGVFLALLPLIIFKLQTGFPGNYSILGYRFTFLSESIVQRNILVLTELTQYVPSFEILFSAISGLYGVSSYAIDWFAIVAVDLFFVGGVYTFLRKTSLSISYSMLGAIISSYVLIWDPLYLFPPIHDLQPRTLMLVMFPFLLSAAIDFAKNSQSQIKRSTISIAIAGIFSVGLFAAMRFMVHPELVQRTLIILPVFSMILFCLVLSNLKFNGGLASTRFCFFFLLTALPLVHSYEGAFYIVLALFFTGFFLLSLRKTQIAWFSSFLFSGATFAVLYLIINNIIFISPKTVLSLPFLPPSSVGAAYTYSPLYSYNALINAISPFIFCLAAIGVAISFFNKPKGNAALASVTTLTLAAIIYFLPIPDIVRVGAAMAPFIPLFAITSIKTFFEALSNYLKENPVVNSIKLPLRRGRLSFSTNIAKFVLVVLVLLVVFAALLVPFQSYLNSKTSNLNSIGSPSHLSLVSDDEYQMGLWLRNNVPEDSMVISDPETMYIMSGISGRSIPISNSMLIEDLQIPDQVRLYWIKFNIFSSQDSERASFYSQALGGKFPLIIVSGRTEKWINQTQFVQAPYNLTNSVVSCNLPVFLNSSSFRLLHEIDGQIYAFTTNVSKQTDINYDTFLVNDYSRFDNLTDMSSGWINATNNWYLSRQVINGPVQTLVYEQYLNNGAGTTPDICWKIEMPQNYTSVSVFVFNKGVYSSDPGSVFSFSRNGYTWVNGNFSYPLRYLFSTGPTDGNLTLYGRGIPGKFSRLGTLIFVGWNSSPSITVEELGWTRMLVDYVKSNSSLQDKFLVSNAKGFESFTSRNAFSLTDELAPNATFEDLAVSISKNPVRYVLLDEFAVKSLPKLFDSSITISNVSSISQMILSTSSVSTLLENHSLPTNSLLLKPLQKFRSATGESIDLLEVLNGSSLTYLPSYADNLAGNGWVAGNLGSLLVQNKTTVLAIGPDQQYTFTTRKTSLNVTIVNGNKTFFVWKVQEVNNSEIKRIEFWSNDNKPILQIYPPSTSGIWITPIQLSEIGDVRIVVSGNPEGYVKIDWLSIGMFELGST